MEVQASAAASSGSRNVERNDNLYDISGGIEQYKGFVVADIDAHRRTRSSFTNGVVLEAGEATGDVTETRTRRIQIREAISAHFDKEQELFAQGIKVLSLFFIDEVAKYRDYDEAGEERRRIRADLRGRIRRQLNEVLTLETRRYNRYLKGIQASQDARRLLLDRQEDQAPGRSRRADARRSRRRIRRRRRLRPDPEGQGTAAVVRGAGAVHLLPLRAARRLGQPERVRDGHAQAQRQHDLPAAGSRARPAPVASTRTASGWTTRPPCTRSTC